MKTTIVPKSIREETGKTGAKYLIIEANDGKTYSAWDNASDKMCNTIGMQVKCEVIVSSQGFNNIKEVYSVSAEKVSSGDIAMSPKEAVFGGVTFLPKVSSGKLDISAQQVKPFIDFKKDTTASVLTSYAKDMWVAGSEIKRTVVDYAEEVTKAYKLILKEL